MLHEAVGDGSAGVLGQAAHPCHLPVGGGEVLSLDAGRSELEHTAPGPGQGVAEREQLVVGGEGAGDRLAVDRLVQDRAAGRHPDRPRLHRFLHDGAHAVQIVGGGRFVAGAPFTHDVGPDGAVRSERGHIERLRLRLQGIEVLGERLPGPADAVVEGGAGDVLDPLHESDQPGALLRGDGREPDTAVAEHQGGDAVPRRRRQGGVPGDLTVVVGVDVDETGGDDLAVGVELLGARGVDSADDGDVPVIDGDIGDDRAGAGAVDHQPVANDQVVHLGSSGTCRPKCPMYEPGPGPHQLRQLGGFVGGRCGRCGRRRRRAEAIEEPEQLEGEREDDRGVLLDRDLSQGGQGP